jgi:DNA repair photolyase
VVVVRAVSCKSVLNKSRIYGVDYAVNPYLGCQHGCVYCYARFMVRYHRHEAPWGAFVDVKINSPNVLSKQLSKTQGGVVLLSSVTDPYQPLEETYELTRKMLKMLTGHPCSVSILTKSSLVLRDLDLLQRFNDCEVGLTITTLNDDVKTCFEPHASPIAERLNALKALHDAGVNTFAFLGPLLPFLVEESLEGLARQFRAVGVRRVLVDRLNIKAGNWRTIRRALETHYPELVPRYEHALFHGTEYFDELKRKVAQYLRAEGVPFTFCY